jgi:hypothetical protein
MNSDAGDTTQLVSGFPIRTPWDHSLVDSSPRPIAASHVLHRLLVPRHPPFALSNLTTKMLASTIQFSTNTQTPHTRHHLTPKQGRFDDRMGLSILKNPHRRWLFFQNLHRVPLPHPAQNPHRSTPHKKQGCTRLRSRHGVTNWPVSPPRCTHNPPPHSGGGCDAP